MKIGDVYYQKETGVEIALFEDGSATVDGVPTPPDLAAYLHVEYGKPKKGSVAERMGPPPLDE